MASTPRTVEVNARLSRTTLDLIVERVEQVADDIRRNERERIVEAILKFADNPDRSPAASFRGAYVHAAQLARQGGDA